MSQSDVREDGLAIRGSDLDDPAYRAYQYHLGGKSWEETARLTGYSSAGSAQVSVRKYITKAAVEMDVIRKQEVLDLEMNRLDKLQDSYWDSAISGNDVKAAEFILKVMGQRAKLLGLELLAEGAGTVTHNTVVVQGDTQEFIRGLRLVDGITDE